MQGRYGIQGKLRFGEDVSVVCKGCTRCCRCLAKVMMREDFSANSSRRVCCSSPVTFGQENFEYIWNVN